MKILHIWDQAAVASVLAKYQRKLGHDALVVNEDGFDGLKQKEFYGVKLLGLHHRRFTKFGILQKPLRFFLRSISSIVFYLEVAYLSHKFDIIHIHSQYLIGFIIPFKSKIIEFHGDDIRKSPSKRNWFDKVATNVYLNLMQLRTQFYVSTVDMLADLPRAVYLPNPVDTELFQPANHYISGTAVYFHNWYENGNHAKQYATEHGLSLSIIDRPTKRIVLYQDMPRYLNNFEYMIDRKAIQSLSKTALEALACGLKVIGYDRVIREGLPLCHDPFVCAKRTLAIYSHILNGGQAI